ncbi:MAG: DUF502 domain-containing protein [Woeseiaceae bacterium]|nr:DUF502 domain-containing protein [Woeseiaceae bacterium]
MKLRRYLVAGILVWVPLAVTFLLLRAAVGLMDRTLLLIPADYRPEVVLQQLFGTENPVYIPGLGVILTFVVLFLTGVLAANFVGRAFVGGWEALMDRIPVVRSVYSAAKNFAEIVFSDSSESFKRVLLIEYPRKGLFSLAFQTSTDLGEVQGRTGEDVVCCFVPTTPNPTSGFVIMVPRRDITVLDMDVDEALKMIISLGVVVPQWRNDRTPDLPFEKAD